MDQLTKILIQTDSTAWKRPIFSPTNVTWNLSYRISEITSIIQIAS